MKIIPIIQRAVLTAGLFAFAGSAAPAQIIKALEGNDSSIPANFVKTHPDAIQLQSLEYVIPEVIIGGEWTSTLRFTNRGTKALPTTNVYLIDDAGNPMLATFQITDGSVLTASAFSVTLGVGGMVEGTFLGGSNTSFGHAIIGCSSAGCGTPGLYGEVALRNRNSTRPDFEAVFPFERPYTLQYMLFDGRNGLTTALYLVNESTTLTQIAIDVVDTNNRILRTVNLTFAGLSSQIQTLHVLAPETIGIQGTLVIRALSGAQAFITATGLRINPTNSFTPLRAFVPAP